MGEEFEKLASRYLFHLGIPVLISSRFLRECGAGQVDYAYYNGSLYLIEIKSHERGLTHIQRRRLENSVKLLAEIFDCDIHIQVLNHLPKN